MIIEEMKKLAGILTEDCKLQYSKKSKDIWTPDHFNNLKVEERTNKFISHINSNENLKAIKPYMVWLKVYTEHRAVIELDRKCPETNGVYMDGQNKRIEINI